MVFRMLSFLLAYFICETLYVAQIGKIGAKTHPILLVAPDVQSFAVQLLEPGPRIPGNRNDEGETFFFAASSSFSGDIAKQLQPPKPLPGTGQIDPPNISLAVRLPDVLGGLVATRAQGSATPMYRVRLVPERYRGSVDKGAIIYALNGRRLPDEKDLETAVKIFLSNPEVSLPLTLSVLTSDANGVVHFSL